MTKTKCQINVKNQMIKVNTIFIFSELRNAISIKNESRTKTSLPTQGLEFSCN